MKHTLRKKLAIFYLAFAFIMLLLLNTVGKNLYENKVLNGKKTLLYKEASSISAEYMKNFYDDSLSLQNLTTKIKAIGSALDARILIINGEGQVISDTKNAVDLSNPVNILDLDPDFLDNTFSHNVSLKSFIHEPMVKVVYRVIHNYRVSGYIVMLSSMKQIHTESIKVIDTINICIFIFLVITLILFICMYYTFIHPIKKINAAALEYTKGNYSFPLHIKRHDEYGLLAGYLSYMAEEISKLDDYQKKFVANISHDFRSPLTSIKGFAEALQDGTIPYEMKDKYLSIILFETERLNKLTSSLLTLNRFENHKMVLDITSFDINHIIKKTAESFEGGCREKKITLNLIFSAKETFVDADMGKIQQVLYNLLDNAIKFSHNNSSIKISTLEKGDKVIISVKDHGIGIPKDDLKRIWERFYKSDASRGKDKKGTGLGLSIAKEIITAHNENINVISTQGVGTEFVFTLPRTEGFII